MSAPHSAASIDRALQEVEAVLGPLPLAAEDPVPPEVAPFVTGVVDGWRVVDDDYGQAVGKLQAGSMMSTAASLIPQ
jgi:hypothetical protein